VLLVGGFYFFIKLIRYALWSWVPYFLRTVYGVGDSRAALFSTAFDLAGLPGVLVTGWLSDRYFGSRRGGVSLIMTLGAVASTGLLISRNYKPGEGLGVVFAMLFGSAVLAAAFCAALVWRNRRGKGI
jgi:OPA family glycerol-3-phosphate transporter-like MFS transporter